MCPDKLVATNAASRLPVLWAKSNTIKAPTGNVSINEANANGSVMFGTSSYSAKKPRPDDAIRKTVSPPHTNPIVMLTKFRKNRML